ncbi:hypothetical protein JCGZ_20855 [Jatropha curcas]|uniref:Uncharacterized protein n=2 Tax=Jatropha curcas TaxID=180498 RepID=A0A067LH02_JATCU|nr:hypothetical protein JCGZ_20855 [Jatropha curcas]
MGKSSRSRILLCDVEKICAPNLLVLRQIGMPQSVIQQLLLHKANLLCFKADKFCDKIKELINMEFCPAKAKFIHVLAAILCSRSNWQHRIEVYGRCGWSRDEIMSAFKNNPRCMTFSEKKIVASMDFLVNVMDLKPSAIAANPFMLVYSLKKRIIPRGLVIKILMLKGVLEENFNFHSALVLTNKCFRERYVDKHKDHITYLQDVFEGRMCPQELGFQYRH